MEKKIHYNIGSGKIYGEKFSEKLEAAAKYRGYEKGEWITDSYIKKNKIKFKSLEDGKEQKPIKISVASKEIVDGKEKWTSKTFEFYNKEQLKLTKKLEKSFKEPQEPKNITPQYNAATGKQYSLANSEKLSEHEHKDQRWITKSRLESIGGKINEGQEPAKIEVYEYSQGENQKVTATAKTIELYNIEQVSLDKVAEKQLVSMEEINKSKEKSNTKENKNELER
ncbi:hypothetical protein [Fusobacterium sp. PH5-44]|uniref:hypothetical protein n=1 Tax=unclassified Fusobacterium TaxID=2648384 RepID=UPI003D190EE1